MVTLWLFAADRRVRTCFHRDTGKPRLWCSSTRSSFGPPQSSPQFDSLERNGRYTRLLGERVANHQAIASSIVAVLSTESSTPNRLAYSDVCALGRSGRMTRYRFPPSRTSLTRVRHSRPSNRTVLPFFAHGSSPTV
ncbi:hypothetical protein STSO111631_03165 [Stackebrandtia soli]